MSPAPYTALLVGYSGLAGRALLSTLAKSRLCTSIVCVGRKPIQEGYELIHSVISSKDTKCKVVQVGDLHTHRDDDDYYYYYSESTEEKNKPMFDQPDLLTEENRNKQPTTRNLIGYCALGARHPQTSTTTELRAVEVTAVVNFARACEKAGVTDFHLLSAILANSRLTVLSELKGEAISEIEKMNFRRISIYQPALLLKNADTRSWNLLGWGTWNVRIHSVVSAFLPLRFSAIPVEDYARAVLLNAETCEPEQRIERLTFVDFMKINGTHPT